ncbi:MAG: SDR family oxidoreductase [Candidatus Kapaibacterium sp.]
MNILVTGATGYIGGRLIPRLLDEGHTVRVLVRDAERIAGRSWGDDVDIRTGNLLQADSLTGLCDDIDVAYYLVHSMGTDGDFEVRDRTAARNFSAVASTVSHVIYLGGLLPDNEEPSKHLQSRKEVGRVLAENLPITEFRAGPIIGSGSASFEMVRYLTERLPVMVTPRWVKNLVQPIAIRDILHYLCRAVDLGPVGIVEVGADPLTFKQMMLRYAEARGLRRLIMPIPVLTPWLAAHWVGLVTPISNRLAVPLVEGVVQPLLAERSKAEEYFPDIHPMSYSEALSLTLAKVESGEVETRWSDSLGGADTFELQEKEGLIREVHTISVNASPPVVFQEFSRAGGQNGWFRWNWLWSLRGAIDAVVGGPGLRRGRRDANTLLLGDALDFWRVEEVVPNQLLRLRAEMKLPGKAWLQWETRKDRSGQTELKQIAIFAPKGLWGLMYWWCSYPFHLFIFRDMVQIIGRRAEEYEMKAMSKLGQIDRTSNER